jgi:tetratricopeptide (TPR) repeat protein
MSEDLGDVLKKVKQDQLLDWKNKGNEAYKKGDFRYAIRCYDKALEIDPNYTDALNNKGLALVKLGKIKEAEQCNEKIKEIQNPPTVKTEQPNTFQLPVFDTSPKYPTIDTDTRLKQEKRVSRKEPAQPQHEAGHFADSCTSGCGTGVSLISGLIGLSLILAGIWTISSGKQAYYMNAYPWNMSIAWTTCLVLGIILLGFAIWLYRSTHVSD